jgi:enamine deaminase RidA (YjgF/YER057c/UK114 family)
VGATPYRNAVARDLVARRPTVVRGNASEIMALAGQAVRTKGVDSTRAADEARDAARALDVAEALHRLLVGAAVDDSADGVGASLDDVVRTRIFVTDIAEWEEVGRAHGEVFGHVRPATSMVEVSRLIAPEMLVEIEADAVVGELQE